MTTAGIPAPVAGNPLFGRGRRKKMEVREGGQLIYRFVFSADLVGFSGRSPIAGAVSLLYLESACCLLS